MLILGIESSCDETGVALYDDQCDQLTQTIYTQALLHANYGGVVPEIASRDHIRHIVPLLRSCLSKANKTINAIDAIAYTAGPGLSGALLVGAGFAEALAMVLKIPLIPINHLEAHLLSALRAIPKPIFPLIALLVSGGHTQFFRVEGIGCYQLIGETLDDAVGEAFDKVAKLLGLPYPGGAKLSKLAKIGNPNRFFLPRPLHQSKQLMMSFAGLKTATANLIKTLAPLDDTTCHDICYAFQQAVVDVLVEKAKRALKKYQITQLIVAGGVSLNYALRDALGNLASQKNWQVYYPPTDLCSDNGGMIALAGALNQINLKSAGSFAIYPRWVLGEPIPLNYPIA
jgi:N6-L-threonylcarbamoyladenine synthase